MNLICSFRRISADPIDEHYCSVIKELKGAIGISKDFQKREFVIGFEMQKELDPIIDKAVKRILSHCTELLINTNGRDSITKLHEVQQMNLLPQAELIDFVEENRPTAASTFIGKYCELSSTYYASCAKGFFEDLKQNNKQMMIFKKSHRNKSVLIGDPVEGDDLKARRRSSLTSFFTAVKNRSGPSSPTSPHEEDCCNDYDNLPYNAASLLIELLRRESAFFKEFFGSSYMRRKTSLNKIFLKCFGIIKSNLKEIVHENSNCLDSLKMMAKVTNLEVQVVSMSDLSSPTQWLNELQNCLYEDFKRLLKKHLESLSNYPELKTSLSSGELRHHFVVKRFANFMKSSLEILKTFQRPWEIVQVELKKLERSFYNWITNISNYIKDRRESLIFQINNFDLVIETCSPVAGADFMASLHFKFDPLIDKFINLEQEKYFYNLLLLLKDPADAFNVSTCSEINLKTKEALKTIVDTFNSSTFTDFANFSVSELVRQKFAKETLEIYSKYLEIYDEKLGKFELKEGEAEVVEIDFIEKILYHSINQ